ncbi:DUF1430 domain-containing protein [Mycoplasma sp. P36-A1]|uniref:DUF1430 domain-containing protein n=1 Tax=Mycoplasma sp. P36-A1 TaxID=3252900 RepID=UPI003C2AEA75
MKKINKQLLKQLIATIVLMFISVSIVVVVEVQHNQNNISKIGYVNDNAAIVTIKSKKEYSKLIDVSLNNEFNICTSKIDKLLHYYCHFNNEELSNNYFEHNYDQSKRYKSYNQDILVMNNLEQLEDYNNTYFITSNTKDINDVLVILQDNNINASISELSITNGLLSDLSRMILIVILVFYVITINLINILQFKSIAVYKIFSSNLQIYLKYYATITIFHFSLVVLSSSVFIFYYPIYNKMLLLSFLLLPFIISFTINGIIYLYIIKANPLLYAKGKIQLSLLSNIYNVSLLICITTMSLLLLLVLNKNTDSNELALQNKSKLSLNKEYFNVSFNTTDVIVELDNLKSNDVKKIDDNNAIYLDNSILESVYSYKNNNEEDNEFTDVYQTTPYIDINDNYLKHYQVSNYYLNNKDIVILYVSSQDKTNIKFIKKRLCMLDNKKISDDKCHVQYYDANKGLFANTLLENNNGTINNLILRNTSNNIANKNLDYYYFLLNNNLLQDNKPTLLDKLDIEAFDKYKDYLQLHNDYYLYEDLLVIVNNTRRITILLITVMIFIIIILISFKVVLYISMNAKLLFIKKIFGYSVYKRYSKLLFLLCFSILFSNCIVIGVSKSSVDININYYYWSILLLIIICMILYLITIVTITEKKKIVNILKGETI